MKKIGRNDPCPCGSGKRYKQCCGSLGKVQAARAHAVDTSIPETFQAALEHHQAGRLPQAEAIYRQILQAAPNHPEALHLSGVIAHQTGRNAIAVELINKAISVNPSSSMYCNLGAALRNQGKLDAAVASYHKALAIKPDFAEAHYNLGIALQQQGKFDAAAASYHQALSIKPDYAEAHGNLGNALQRQGRLDAAVASYLKALSIKPDFAEAHSNLGNALKDQGKLDAAIASHHQALSIKPDYVEAYSNLGIALQQQGRLDAAVASFRKALAIKPDYAVAHNNLGNALQHQDQLDAAVASYLTALAIKPDYAEAHYNLGTALQQQGKLDTAIASYRKALAIKPDYADAYSNYLLTALYGPDYSPAELLAEHLAFAERFEAPLRANWPAHDNHRDFQRRLRVGFVSADLRAHPVGFFLESVLAHLAQQALDIFLYPNHSEVDALTKRLQGMGFAWKSLVGLPDERAADRVREDAIDILVDLSGHTGGNRLRLFARKPAPVQVTWLGYFATTGLRAMDYVLCDRYVAPANESDHFVEKPWYLPNTRLCFTPPQAGIAVGALPALTNGRVTFGCFNNLIKMNDAVVALWAQVLHAVPGSRLFLKNRQLNDPSLQRATLSHFAARGVTPERLALEGASSRSDYLAAYNRVDIALDPFPFTGGTTSVEGLWMGVPVITKQGDRLVAHQGESILHNVGLADWIAADNDAYVAIAVARATDLSSLATLRAKLRSRLLGSPLCDAPLFARNLEAAFRGMWQAYCNQAQAQKIFEPR